MKRRIFILPILGATLLAGCMREQPAAPEAQQQKSIYDQEDLAVIRDIEQLDREAEGVLAKSAAVVELPDGSVDALAAAIAAAGPGGVVRVLSGEHRESGTVTITHAVKILGEAGANLVFDSKPTTVAGAIDPALHILNAPEVMIFRVKIRAQEDIGGTGILIEDSPRAMIGRNEIIDYQFSIMLEDGDHARIWKNTISATPAWLTTFFAVHGVVVINGNKVRMVENDVSNAFFGVWACDREGRFFENNLHGNFIGLILCKVPQNAFPLPGGELAGSDTSAIEWRVKGNQATGNFNDGYLVIDGANNNLLSGNAASGNAAYDIELSGDSFRFGFLTPKSFENTVITGQFSNLKIKNCGENNTVVGGQLVDNSLDPCF